MRWKIRFLDSGFWKVWSNEGITKKVVTKKVVIRSLDDTY